MGLVRVEEVDNVTEELIIAGMISSNSYLSYVAERIQLRYFRSEQCKVIAKLILEFFTNHKRSPGASMRELYESAVDDLPEDDAFIISRLLKNIAKKYGDREISFEVLKDTTDGYFEIRAVETLIGKVSGLASRGKIPEALKEIDDWYKDPKRHIVTSVSPFDTSMAEAVMTADRLLYRFKDDLDSVLPPQMSNKLYTLLGGTKSGKSQWLGHFAVCFAEAGLKVAIWQFELTETEYIGRLMSNISGKEIDPRHDSDTKDVELSVFDCEHNRDRSCAMEECPDNDDFENFDKYVPEVWTPCSFCKGQPEFSPVVWKMEAKIGVINSINALKKEQVTWLRQFGDNIRMFPGESGHVTSEDVKNQLMRLRLSEGFIPDVIIVDQADNIAASSRYHEKRHEIGSVWLDLATLAKQGYLVWTASQTNRGGWGKEWIETSDVGEDASKFMVCSGVVTINQYKGGDFDEYDWNTQRLRAFYFRNAKIPGRDVRVLNDFSRYIACLDCCKM